LRSNVTPEVFYGRFCACALKVAKMAQNQAKTQVMYEAGRGELYFVQY